MFEGDHHHRVRLVVLSLVSVGVSLAAHAGGGGRITLGMAVMLSVVTLPVLLVLARKSLSALTGGVALALLQLMWHEGLALAESPAATMTATGCGSHHAMSHAALVGQPAHAAGHDGAVMMAAHAAAGVAIAVWLQHGEAALRACARAIEWCLPRRVRIARLRIAVLRSVPLGDRFPSLPRGCVERLPRRRGPPRFDDVPCIIAVA